MEIEEIEQLLQKDVSTYTNKKVRRTGEITLKIDMNISNVLEKDLSEYSIDELNEIKLTTEKTIKVYERNRMNPLLIGLILQPVLQLVCEELVRRNPDQFKPTN